MTQEQLTKVVEERLESCRSLLESKGRDYSDHDRDRLSNFKVVAQLLNTTPQVVWAVYFLKHVIALTKHAQSGELASEPVEGRVDDVVNYALLYAALCEEGKEGAAQYINEDFFDPEKLPVVEEPPIGPTVSDKLRALFTDRTKSA